MEKMTRNEAATYLHVEPQTITNWMNRGLLGGYNDKESKRVWVNADDVRRYADRYKMLSTTEDLLAKEQKELIASERKVNAKMNMLIHDALNISSFSYGHIGELLCTLWNLVAKGGEREKTIVQAFFNGAKIAEIANSYNLTSERIRQIILKAIRKFNAQLEELVCLKAENNTLKAEIYDIRQQLIMQEGERKDEQPEGNIPTSVFSLRLIDCNLPVRVLNVAKEANIETVADLVQHSKEDLMKLRNCGRKSLSELDDFVDSMGLEWEMDKAKIYARGVQRMHEDTYMGNIFRKHLAEMTSVIAAKYDISPADAVKKAYGEMKRYVELNEKENNERSV